MSKNKRQNIKKACKYLEWKQIRRREDENIKLCILIWGKKPSPEVGYFPLPCQLGSDNTSIA